uniref:Integrase catalytic domain-containing protein n=1 Tax=Trichuris muris TaxID=70415 RepID=A0A5S6Q5M4_TRIMR
MKVDGVERRVLVDTGCIKCVAYISCCKAWQFQHVSLIAVNGQRLRSLGIGAVYLQPVEGGRITVEVIVTDTKPLGFDFILGMNGIVALGGVTVDDHRRVSFGVEGAVACAVINEAEIRLEEQDFVVRFSPMTRSWTARWKWTDGKEPDVLQNTVKEYSPVSGARASYEEELEEWFKNGWLVPYDTNKYGQAKGLIPLMAIVQRNKKKVRPVMDFRELNTHIETFTGDSDVCAQKLRAWRKQGTNVSVLDLKRAYLQVHIDKSLWPYQTVVYKGCRYCMTRLGFGLNVAPLVMKTVLSCALSQDQDVRKGTSAYIDDILVNEDIVKADRVVQHLLRFGLTCKAPVRVADGARVLGLKVWGERGNLIWRRDSEIGVVPKLLTRRSVFSYCGKLTGHFPVCGWLRVAAALVKRKANNASTSWDDRISDESLETLLQEISARVKKEDPVRGRWDVPGNRARIWADASSIALGVVLEVNGYTVENAAWLRRDDARHINMVELDAVIKGLNIALSRDMKIIELMTDSSTVYRWISDGLSGKARLRTKAASEMLIRRRVSTVLALVKEYALQITITLVKSAKNKADALTRVSRPGTKSRVAVCTVVDDTDYKCLIAKVHHEAGHPGVRRTLYFAKRVNPTVCRRQVREVITSCETCRFIDPAPERWKRGSLGVKKVWWRVARDITHCRGKSYLALVDCGPSRFALWRPLRFPSSANVIQQLESVFYERGAPMELLTDNNTAFRSNMFMTFAAKWNIRIRFRCAYVPAGNGIAERCHRTVKVIAARKGCPISEAVYQYNVMPRDDRSELTAPANVLYRYTVRVRSEESAEMTTDNNNNSYAVGDTVWVKPNNVKCDSKYQSGTISRIVSSQAAEVDGVPRHVRDLRRRAVTDEAASQRSDASDSHEEMIIRVPARHTEEAQLETSPEETTIGPRRSTRLRRPRVSTCCDFKKIIRGECDRKRPVSY